MPEVNKKPIQEFVESVSRLAQNDLRNRVAFMQNTRERFEDDMISRVIGQYNQKVKGGSLLDDGAEEGARLEAIASLMAGGERSQNMAKMLSTYDSKSTARMGAPMYDASGRAVVPVMENGTINFVPAPIIAPPNKTGGVTERDRFNAGVRQDIADKNRDSREKMAGENRAETKRWHDASLGLQERWLALKEKLDKQNYGDIFVEDENGNLVLSEDARTSDIRGTRTNLTNNLSEIRETIRKYRDGLKYFTGTEDEKRKLEEELSEIVADERQHRRQLTALNTPRKKKATTTTTGKTDERPTISY